MLTPATLTFLLLVGLASIPAYWIAATLTDLARRTPQRRRDHIAHTAANMPAAQIAAQVRGWCFDADQQAAWDAHCRDAVAVVRGEGRALDSLAAAEADRADWTQIQKWSER